MQIPPFPKLLPLRGAVLSLLLSGCSLAVDAGRSQCQVDRDCTTGPLALAAAQCVDGLCDLRTEWSCAGATAQLSPAEGSALVDVALPVVDLLARDTAAQLEMSLCHKLDVNCEAPAQVMSLQGAGDFPLSLDGGFEGYLSVRGDDVVPTLYFLSPPLQAGERLPALTLMSPSLMGSLAVEMGVELLPERGLAQFTVQDCDGAFAPGISFEAAEADAATARYYDMDGLPALPAVATGREGSGGFLNAPAGAFSVVAKMAEGEAPLAGASVLIRPGFISHGRLRPAPPGPDPALDGAF